VSGHIVKRDDVVEMPLEIAVALLDLACYPPKKHSASTTYGAKVPWRWIVEVRAMLDDAGFDWKGVHDKLTGGAS
jgi:hypothetical protein